MNEQIFLYFHNLTGQSQTIDELIYFLADTLPYIALLGAGIFLAYHYDVLPRGNPFKNFFNNWKKFAPIVVSLVSAWVVANVLKIILSTPRPLDFITDITPIIEESGYGFPSSHTTFFMALAVAIYMTSKKAGTVFIIIALVIGLARISAGVHSPVDILGGLVVGAIIAYLVKRSFQSIESSESRS
ncbi:MAG TPA: phosphatase PAP2 family protein [Candidatus Paceibacterota bacterium]|nr:phosphatase PAP2 family protein [Candidatus Paceibacterota bacterium]